MFASVQESQGKKEYSKEEIEQKRQQALQRKAKKDCSPKSQSSPLRPKLYENPGSSNSFQRHRSSPSVMKNQRRNERFNPIATKSFYDDNQIVSVSLSLTTSERFTADMSVFSSQLVEVFKTVPSRSYDTKARLWSFSLEDYNTLIAKLVDCKPQVVIQHLPKTVLNVVRHNLQKKKNETDSIDLSRIDQTLVKSLMPFQRDGICYGISRDGRCMIADDMGLGKTIQALGLAHYYKDDWPLLIVTPSSVRYQWSEAIIRFLPSVPTQRIQQFTNSKDFLDHSHVTIVTYDILARAIDTFEKFIFGFVILDESHVLKSCKTARFKTVQRIASQARHVVLLSGTPALSRPVELYTQISLICPKFMSYEEYGKRYCAGKMGSFGWDFSGSSNVEELQIFLRACCVIRRMKDEVLGQLPSKLRQIIVLDDSLIKKGAKEMKDMSKKLQKRNLKLADRQSTLIQYYNETSIAKSAAVCKYVENLLENHKKFLIFAHHQIILDSISELLESKKVRYIRIDGRTTQEQRKTFVDRFQSSSDCRVAVLSITAANAGITLTAAQLVVFVELYWNPGVMCQAEDRVHRIGQTKGVVIQYLLANETADDYIWPLLKDKMNVLNDVGLNQNFSLSDAEVTKQTSVIGADQSSLDDFVSVPKKSESKEKSAANTSKDTSGEYDHLLEMDNDDFDNIDLDFV